MDSEFAEDWPFKLLVVFKDGVLLFILLFVLSKNVVWNGGGKARNEVF